MPPAAGPGFPVTITHQFGSTTIPAEPGRVVVAGLVEQDPLLALGVVPVATTEWFGDFPGAIQPWARDELGDAVLPAVLSQTDGFQFEQIAALHPDLIVALGLQITAEVAALPASDVPGRAIVSPENLAVLDADAMTITYGTDGDRTFLESNEIFQQLDAVRDGRYFPLDQTVPVRPRSR